MQVFAWDEWNVDHIAKHEVVPAEAEFVVEHADAPWPEKKEDEKLVVWGPTEMGRLLQVLFVLKSADEVEFDSLTISEWAELSEEDRIVYVIHAMDLTPPMKRTYRRRRRQ